MDKNLIVKISNGFGNQMFLYATAYAFAKKLNYNLLIDNETGINLDLKKWKKKKRLNWKPKYELDIFNLKSNIADSNYKFPGSFGRVKRKYIKFIDKFSLKKNYLSEHMNENKRTSYSDIYSSQRYSNTVYLEGYLFDPPEAQEAFQKAAAYAKLYETKVVFTLSDAFCVERHREKMKEFIAKHVDILFCNEGEIKSLYERTFKG